MKIPKQRLINFAKKPYRLLTARERVLPDYIIIGVGKCGTSSMYNYLTEHPQVHRAFHKETHFFKKHFDKGENWYRSKFPLKKEMRPGDITGEASPGYAWYEPAPERIKQMLPAVKLICLMRNPTERVISHYFMMVRFGRESLPIMEAIQSDAETLFAKRRKKLTDRILGNDDGYRFTYLKQGIYINHLRRYRRHFDSKQMLFLCSERFFADPQATMRKVFGFLEIDPEYTVKDLRAHAAGSNKRRVEEEVYAYLDNYYRPYNEALYEELGEDFGWQFGK